MRNLKVSDTIIYFKIKITAHNQSLACIVAIKQRQSILQLENDSTLR